MNKCLRQNWRLFNKISFRPIQLEQPNDIENSNAWCERIWSHLCNDELNRLACHIRKGKQGYSITVWEDGECVYLVQVIRGEFNTDDTTIYAAPYTDSNVSDFLAIAKFVHKNIENIISHSKNNVNQFNTLAAMVDAKDIADGRA